MSENILIARARHMREVLADENNYDLSAVNLLDDLISEIETLESQLAEAKTSLPSKMEILKKDDGIWLFVKFGHDSAGINLNELKGDIIRRTFMNWASGLKDAQAAYAAD